MATRSPEEIKQAYADSHGIGPEKVDLALRYRSAFQQAFNGAVGSSQFHETFEVQASNKAKAAGFITKIISSLTSFVGGSLIEVAGSAAVEFDKKRRESDLDNISELKPAIESCGSRLQEFTEQVVEDLTIASLRQFDNLDKKQAAKMARKDAGILLKEISAGKFDEQIENSQIMGLSNNPEEEQQALDSLRKSMVEAVLNAKGLNFQQEENLMKARVAARELGEGNNKEGGESEASHPHHHDHKIVGEFTRNLVKHENDAAAHGSSKTHEEIVH